MNSAQAQALIEEVVAEEWIKIKLKILGELSKEQGGKFPGDWEAIAEASFKAGLVTGAAWLADHLRVANAE